MTLASLYLSNDSDDANCQVTQNLGKVYSQPVFVMYVLIKKTANPTVAL